ncbi:MAG: LPS export ABC transporter permease LptG [Thiotrichaceae bacterium]|nr:LPS export ABC transporter permease LptG [Thiotrichaceae bacterium]PCI14377.1 MAG: LPS export ABC transporter permease LptG [Thiotrichales bacterium]
MGILDRYIMRTVIGSVLLVMLILLALFAFAAFVNELSYIGKGDYSALLALSYVALTLPRLAYDLFPVAALLGSVMGLGVMASNSELVVMRSAGISIGRITWSVMKAGLILVAVAVIISEFVSSESERLAQEIRSEALAGHVNKKIEKGFWTRDDTRIINVRRVLSSGELRDIYIYEIDEQRRLTLVIYAKSAIYEDNQWVLNDASNSRIRDDGVESSNIIHMPQASLVDPDIIDVIAIKPRSLSAFGLYKYIEYLKDNDLNAAHYEMVFWSKVILPFATAVMVFLSIPFVFGPLRSVGVGVRVLVGTLVGISFYVIHQMSSYVGLVFHINPALSAVLPTLVFFIASLLMMRRIK